MATIKPIYKAYAGGMANKITSNGISIRGGLFLHEKWGTGIPPSGPAVNSEIQTPGNPLYYATLKNLGLKANGVVTIINYPGGMIKYFNEIVKPIIDANTVGMTASYTGAIMIDIEELLPSTLPEILDYGIGCDISVKYIQQILGVQNVQTATSFYNGICAQYYPILINYFRIKFPKAKLVWYGTPYSGSYWNWVTPNQSIMTATKLACVNEAAWLWPLVDYLCPQFYMIYDTEANWGKAGELKYEDWYALVTPHMDFCNEMKQITKKPLMPAICSVYPQTAMDMAGKALEVDDWDVVGNMLKYVNADAAILWAASETQAQTDQYNLGLQRGRVVLENFRQGLLV